MMQRSTNHLPLEPAESRRAAHSVRAVAKPRSRSAGSPMSSPSEMMRGRPGGLIHVSSTDPPC